MQVIEDSNGNISIEPDINYIQAVYNGIQPLADAPTDENELLESLKDDFPMYTHQIIDSTSKYCSYLNAYRDVWATESRTNYVKKTVDWGSWAAGTVISIIATFLGLPAPIASIVLTSAGIALSSTGMILESVSLARSAKYVFSGDRYGVVYDSTTYDSPVSVLWYPDSGEFAGGYDSEGNFTWIISEVPSVYDSDPEEIMTIAMDEYNSCLAMYGSNLMYPPVSISP